MTPFFRSFKTISGIPVQNTVTREALIRLTFNPRITAIGYIGTIPDGTGIRTAAIFVQGQAGRYLLNIEPSLRVCERVIDWSKGLGIDRMIITEEEIKQEPQYSNERAIWQCCQLVVPVHLRMQIFAQLHRRAPLSMHDLLSSISGFNCTDEAIFSLACSGLVQLTLDAPLSGDTKVRMP